MKGYEQFLCDGTVVKLGKRLRTFGYDVEIIYKTDSYNVSEILKSTNRILVTKSLKLHKQLGGIYLISDKLTDLLNEISTKIGKPGPARCAHCNAILIECDKSTIRGKVPIYVFQTHEKFKYCPNCGKVYWKGTHVSQE